MTGFKGLAASAASAAILLCFGLTSANAAPAAQQAVTAGMKISGAVRLRPGIYRVADVDRGVLQITGSGFEIDLAGVRLAGPGRGEGIGIHIVDARNVTIRNADVSGYRWGIVVERSSGVRLVRCRTSRNADLKPGTVIDESGREPEDQWGGGVLLRDCESCLVKSCESRYQWDGIDVIRCRQCSIQDGDYSFNGNWGVHFWDSSHNAFSRNRAVWCTTGGGRLYQALTGWQTYDAQAVAIDHNSCDNIIEGNDLRFGGDAIFIRANEGPLSPGTAVPPRNGSHRNVLRNNDCSFSPNNAIEADFVDDTVIESNNCSNSHYGMWLGYSRRCKIRGNLCINDTAHAVEIENGQDDVFDRNVFGWDTPRSGEALVILRQNGHDATPSSGYRFEANTFYGAAYGVRLRATSASLIGNIWESPSASKGQSALVLEETPSSIREVETRVQSSDDGTWRLEPLSAPIRPGSLFTIRSSASARGAISVVEIDGVPVWLKPAAHPEGRSGQAWMPADMWVRPAKSRAVLRARTDGGWSAPLAVSLAWPGTGPRIESITPDPAAAGDLETLGGFNLGAGVLLINGRSVPMEEQSDTRIRFRLPGDLPAGMPVNVVWERQTPGSAVRTWPIVLNRAGR